MMPADRDLVDEVRDFKRYLNEGATIRLVNADNYDDFIEKFRDLGHDFADLGGRILARVREIDSASADAGVGDSDSASTGSGS